MKNNTIAHTTLGSFDKGFWLSSNLLAKRPDDVPRPWDKEEEGDEYE